MDRRFYIIFLIAFAIFLFVARKAKYGEFHHARIDGKIDTLFRYKDYVMIYINKDEFRIIPEPLYKAPQLDNIATIGDSTFKKADNDTLNLFHKGSRYLYVVQTY